MSASDFVASQADSSRKGATAEKGSADRATAFSPEEYRASDKQRLGGNSPTGEFCETSEASGNRRSSHLVALSVKCFPYALVRSNRRGGIL